MNKRTHKKGFTIVELVIVIAVIAILAAVLIPTFSGLIKKANLSADQQAVRQMNTALAVEGAVENNDIFDVYDALSEMGMSAEDYKPLTEDTYFFWDAELDRVLHVDENYKVLYPAEYADLNYEGRTWVSLTQRIATQAPTGYESGTTTAVTVNSGAELLYVLDDINKGESSKEMKITIPAEGVDMMGAAFSVPKLDTGAGYTIELTGGPILNATAVNIADADGKNEYGNTGEGHDGLYGCSLFGIVNAGNTLKIHDVTFENLNVKNTNASGAAILVGGVYSTSNAKATVEIFNVTIKNSAVVGHRSVGALIGINQGCVKLSGQIKLENVQVMTVGGRSGMLVGQNGNGGANQTFTDSATITLNNCSLEMYRCDQNTGTYEGQTLGLANGQITSWFMHADGTEECKAYPFDSNAIQGMGTFSFTNVVKN